MISPRLFLPCSLSSRHCARISFVFFSVPSDMDAVLFSFPRDVDMEDDAVPAVAGVQSEAKEVGLLVDTVEGVRPT